MLLSNKDSIHFDLISLYEINIIVWTKDRYEIMDFAIGPNNWSEILISPHMDYVVKFQYFGTNY